MVTWLMNNMHLGFVNIEQVASGRHDVCAHAITSCYQETSHVYNRLSLLRIIAACRLLCYRNEPTRFRRLRPSLMTTTTMLHRKTIY